MVEAKNGCMSFYIIRKILNEKGQQYQMMISDIL